MNGIAASEIVRALASRDPLRTEADIQAGIRDLLLHGGFNLQDEDVEVRLESQVGDQRRIDVEAGFTIIEVKKDLRKANILEEAIAQLAGYVKSRTEAFEQRFVGILSDGIDWRLFHLTPEGTLQQVSTFQVNPSDPHSSGLVGWLGAVLATQENIPPTPREVDRRLGSESPAFRLDTATLHDVWEESKTIPEVALKRHLWARLLTTALGSAFEDSDELFLNHTYLVVCAEIIAHRVLGLPVEGVEPIDLVSGRLFRDAGVFGVVEPDFFDWVAEVPGGDRFVRDLVRRVSRFDWSKVEHDVLKHLYESVISDRVRKRLGEYYTPDFLAEAIVTEIVDDPAGQRILDPACGSGTFLFHAVRHYLAAADAAGASNPDSITGVVGRVAGLDLHPVAVALARTTYLLGIGRERLLGDRPIFTVPVWLGDSLQWQIDHDLFGHDGISIQTDDGAGLFAERLNFPMGTLTDAEDFDELVRTLCEKATSRTPGAARPKIAGLLKSRGITGADAETVEETFSILCGLHDSHRDHIWNYYIQNLTRPLWLTRGDGKVDRLVGNPPWLAYRFMTEEMQETFRTRCRERNLWTGGRVATQQDLSAYFVVRCAELYLRAGGRFGFVMPKAALTRQAFEGFRKGIFAGTQLAFDPPWDLEAVRPSIFPVPSGVVLGAVDAAHDWPITATIWSGSPSAPEWSDGALVATGSDAESVSPYGPRFAQGATIVPRVLHIVEEIPAVGALGLPSGVVRVRSHRTSLEKEPWKSLPDREANVEDWFVLQLFMGSSLLPFRMRDPEKVVLPIIDGELVDPGSSDLDEFPLLRQWTTDSAALWEKHGKSAKMSANDRLDYHRGLTRQVPAAQHRVAYSASGNVLTASRVPDGPSIVEHKLYWAGCSSEDEAFYLTAVLNARETTTRVEPLQSRGLFGPRDFDKYVWLLPIPPFSPAKEAHAALVDLARRAEAAAETVDVDGIPFQRARGLIRTALADAGIGEELDAAVRQLLDGSAE